uniref:Antizyme inhibitor 2 n=1 Tax=Rousettus aegyptiacus TaxID=9407 RepID=A0A7J8K536_ROUAE|nr:antizyme inhibitor 2 [Rousettus aegyptiacus]
MAGYLSETDFMMVEEGFSTQDLLEELTLGASQATTGEVAAFFVADLGTVVRKHFCFLKCLPRVRPFYAVKCNSSLGVLKVLAELGLGFSCANKVSPCPNQHTDPCCLPNTHMTRLLWVGPGKAGVTCSWPMFFGEVHSLGQDFKG